MKAIILAGGLGERLKPFTEILPKPLLPIAGEQTVLEIQISRLKQHGFTDIYIATNYMSEMIESYMGNGSKYGVNLTFSKELIPLGTCGPISLLQNNLSEPFLVMNGDIITNLHFRDFYDFGVRDDSKLVVCTKELTQPFDFGNVIAKNNKIISIEEKPNLKFIIVAGIYIMKPSIFQYLPHNKFFGFDDLMKIMLSKSDPITSYLMDDYWIDVGRYEDLDKARKDMKHLQDK